MCLYMASAPFHYVQFVSYTAMTFSYNWKPTCAT
uniref:Uncharacterized protein n=1 Tax=Arundo donax TaxID=35708 RepID=A0A0A9ESK4_ARUDO